jgi:hypothetical protein
MSTDTESLWDAEPDTDVSVAEWKSEMGPPDAALQSQIADREGLKSYVGLTIATIVSCFFAYVILIIILQALDRKPPPAFTNNLCIDGKIEFLRQNSPVDPTHLVIGSSISWRNIDSSTIVDRHPQSRPLNGGFCSLHMNQIAFVSDFLIKRYPTVSDLLLVLDVEDMAACRQNKTILFNENDVASYLSKANDIQFYFKYFSPISLLRNAMQLKERKQNLIELDPLVFTAYADGPLNTSQERGLFYGTAPPIDNACVDALRSLANAAKTKKLRLTVATMPLPSTWSEKYDQDAVVQKKFTDTVRTALDGTGTQFWDGWAEAKIDPKAYTDAYHLRWSAVPAFTQQLIKATQFGSSDS